MLLITATNELCLNAVNIDTSSGVQPISLPSFYWCQFSAGCNSLNITTELTKAILVSTAPTYGEMSYQRWYYGFFLEKERQDIESV